VRRVALASGATVSSAAVRVPGRGEYGKTWTFVIPSRSTSESVRSNAARPRREADDHVRRQVEARERASRRSNCDALYRRPIARRTPSSPDCSGTWRCGETVGVSREPSTSASSTWLTSIDESRRRSTPGASRLADEPGERVAGGAVAEAAEVHAGQDDLAMPCAARRRISPSTASAVRLRVARGRGDHTEGARERAPVLDLDERAHPIEPVLGVDAADRADVAATKAAASRPSSRDDDVRPASPKAPSRFEAQPVTYTDRAERARARQPGATSRPPRASRSTC
jgi:hypothetical protein